MYQYAYIEFFHLELKVPSFKQTKRNIIQQSSKFLSLYDNNILLYLLYLKLLFKDDCIDSVLFIWLLLSNISITSIIW